MIDLDLERLVTSANCAPSVHNTQPTRWSRDRDGALWLKADMARQLLVGDATGRDLRVSLGAALEGTILALSQQGLAASVVDLPASVPSARIEISDGSFHDPLTPQVGQRCTWRGGFADASTSQKQGLAKWAGDQTDIAIAEAPADIDAMSRLNEKTSLTFYRRAAYRHELVSWMRLSLSDPDYGFDGLSSLAMGMSRLEAIGASIVLGDPGFSILDRVGLVAPLISEKSRTRSSVAVLLFHRPCDENPIDTGRALYRRQLELSRLGLQTWPMSVLADDLHVAEELSARFGLSDERRLITAWRVGPLPTGAQPRRERLPPAALIIA